MLGVVEGATGAWDRAVWLLGAERGLAHSQRVPPLDLIAPERERTLAVACESLGPEGFRGRFEAGRRSSRDKAVAFALGV